MHFSWQKTYVQLNKSINYALLNVNCIWNISEREWVFTLSMFYDYKLSNMQVQFNKICIICNICNTDRFISIYEKNYII